MGRGARVARPRARRVVSRPSWEVVKPIVADALELDTGERVAFLERSCGDDADLRAEVESLLAAAERTKQFVLLAERGLEE